jgi:hypothetical protein
MAASRPLRLVLCVALAAGLSWPIGLALGLGSASTYGVVIAVLVIRPDFGRVPAALFLLLPVVVVVGLSLGTLLKQLVDGPLVWQFAIVTAWAQLLGQTLPDKLMVARNLLPILAILPLLSSNSTWLAAWHEALAVCIGMGVGAAMQASLRLPGEASGEAPEGPPPLPARSLAQRFADPYFWRKLVFSALALSIGMGLGAVNPKYVYFGVVILLNDSVGATLLRVRDRMVGVSLGVVMPWLVFNTIGLNSVAVGLVMGGTTALIVLLRLDVHLRTALISSGVTFVGYGALTDWYIPTRWIDYLLGCGLALAVCVFFAPSSALQTLRTLARQQRDAGRLELTAEMVAMLPSARAEARWLGQEQQLQEELQELKPQGKP